MDQREFSTVAELFKNARDPRQRRGRRYSWGLILTLITAALACGQFNGRAIGQWVREHQELLIQSLGLTCRRLPSEATLRRALRHSGVVSLQQAITEHLQQQAQQLTSERVPLAAQAVDGKQVRGVARYAPPLMVVSRVAHGSGYLLDQEPVAPGSSEQRTARQLLARADLRGVLLTMDALHTDAALAAEIVARGGHYLMVVKKNRLRLYADIDCLWQMPPWQGRAEPPEVHSYQSVGKQHGRLERRTLESSTALNEYLHWPAVAQVLRRRCRIIHTKTGELRETTTYAITSLPRELADAAQLEHYWRGHWTIENRVHYVRDVTFAEDACRIHTAQAPLMLTLLRNLLIALVRLSGWRYLPDAIRHFAADPTRALRLLGALP